MSTSEPATVEPAPRLDQFPDRPSVSMRCWPIYLSPVAGSGESVIVGMAGISDEGKAAHWACLNKAIAGCAFGSGAAPQVLGWTQAALSDAESHLVSVRSLDNWQPRFDGMRHGEMIEMSGDTMERAMMSAAELIGASFARKALDQLRDEIMLDQESIEDPVQSVVRERVVALRPNWAGLFYYKHKPKANARPVTIFFADGQYACNLTRVVPQKISYYEQRFKIALYDLLAYRDTSPLAPKDTELLLRIPVLKNLPDDQRLNVDQLLDQFDAVADKEKLRIRRVTSDDEAVRRILRMDA